MKWYLCYLGILPLVVQKILHRFIHEWFPKRGSLNFYELVRGPYIYMNWSGNVYNSMNWSDNRQFRGMDVRSMPVGKKHVVPLLTVFIFFLASVVLSFADPSFTSFSTLPIFVNLFIQFSKTCFRQNSWNLYQLAFHSNYSTFIQNYTHCVQLNYCNEMKCPEKIRL